MEVNLNEKAPPGLPVLSPGSSVFVGSKGQKYPGTIVAFAVDIAMRITYRVVWWSGPRRNQEWMDASEVSPGSQATSCTGVFQLPKGQDGHV